MNNHRRIVFFDCFCLYLFYVSSYILLFGRCLRRRHSRQCLSSKASYAPCMRRYDSARRTQFNLPKNRILSSRFSGVFLERGNPRTHVCAFLLVYDCYCHCYFLFMLLFSVFCCCVLMLLLLLVPFFVCVVDGG